MGQRDDEDVDHNRAAYDDDDNNDRTVLPNTDKRKPLMFYKLMVASILRDDKLKIPGKIVKRIEHELSIVITVSVPDGKKWNVRLRKDGGKCWFGDGWNEFMKYYNVRIGYLLVFRYKGDSTFVVNIFNLSKAEIQYLPDPVDLSERVRQEKQCSMGKGNVSENGDTLKKLDSVEVTVNKLDSVTNDMEYGNIDTQKMPYFASQDSTDVTLHVQQISCIIHGLLQSKFSELRSEVLSQIMSEMGGSEEVQLEKQCSTTETDQLGSNKTTKRPLSEIIRQANKFLEKKGEESRNNVTRKISGSENIEEDILCSGTSHTDPANHESQKKFDLTPPGFGKPSQQTPGIEKLGSSLSGARKATKPSGEASSPSPFSLVKDVSPGYYRASIMSIKNTKQVKTKKTKSPLPANPVNDGTEFEADGSKLNSQSKEELTPGIQLTDSVDKTLPEPKKLYPQTHPTNTVNIPSASASQLNVHTPLKRKKEINYADLLNKTMPITVPARQRVDVSTVDILNCESEMTAKVQKKQKTVQLSDTSKPLTNPRCMVHMRFSYVQRKSLLNIPSDFAKYLQKATDYATLENSEGEQWKVRIFSSNGQSKLRTGWYQFVEDNDLKEGDACIFELVDSVSTLLKVSFIRVSKANLSSK